MNSEARTFTSAHRIVAVRNPEGRFWRRWKWSVERDGYPSWEVIATGFAGNKREAINKAVDRALRWHEDLERVEVSVKYQWDYTPPVNPKQAIPAELIGDEARKGT